VLWIPPLGWEVGYFFWGWFVDHFAARNERPSWLFFTLALLSLPLVTMARFSNSAIVLALMFWSMFISSGFVVAALRTSAFAYPREQAGPRRRNRLRFLVRAARDGAAEPGTYVRRETLRKRFSLLRGWCLSWERSAGGR